MRFDNARVQLCLSRSPYFCSLQRTFNMSLAFSSPETNPLDRVMNHEGAQPNVLHQAQPIYPRTLYGLPFPTLKEGFPRPQVAEDQRWDVLGRGWSRMSNSRKRRLVRNLQDGIATGYFGGMGGLSLCLNMIQWEVNKHADLGYGIRVPVHSECESDPSKQKHLMAYPERHRARHIFSNIFGRLPADVQRDIKENTPTTAILKDAKLMSNMQIKRIITDAYQSRGKECDASHCIIHGEGCSIDPPAPPGSSDIVSGSPRGVCHVSTTAHTGFKKVMLAKLLELITRSSKTSSTASTAWS